MFARLLVVGAVIVSVTATPAAAQIPRPLLIVDTSLGKIKLELFPDKAPETVKNFLKYADDKFYDGTIFHRVIDNFMIQGGGMEPGLKEKKTRPPIKNESDNGVSNARGTIAMARTVDPNSATAQFFINVKDNAYLDAAKAPGRAGYAAFGRVVEGMDIVDRIKKVATGARGGHQDVPLTDVVILSIRRAAQLSLAVSGAFRPQRLLTITAYVEYPVPGQHLMLELPAGLERIEGKELQPVPMPEGRAAVIVLWKARPLQAGDFEVAVRSSTGLRLVHKIKVTEPR